MLPSHNTIWAGSLQRQAVRALTTVPCHEGTRIALRFTSIPFKSSLCTSSWSRSRQCYFSRSLGTSKLRQSRLPPLGEGIYDTSYNSSIGNNIHSGYRYLSYHGSRRSNSWGRFGYGQGGSDRRFGNDSRFKEDKSLNWDTYSRNVEETIGKELEDLKKRIDEDPYEVLFGRRWRSHPPKDVSHKEEMNEKAGKSKGIPLRNNTSNTQESVFTSHDVRQDGGSRSTSMPSTQDGARATAFTRSQHEDLEFDPITMRKVPKTRSHAADTPDGLGTDGSSSIPVKPFINPISKNIKISTFAEKRAHASPQALVSKPKNATAVFPSNEPDRGWLAREGFDARDDKNKESSPSLFQDDSTETTNAHLPKIETVLDRRIKAKEISLDHIPADPSSLKYAATENKEEDIDLLRASDVRASAGISKRASKPTAEEDQKRRSFLSDSHERRDHELDRRLKEELASQHTRTYTEAEVAKKPPNHSEHQPTTTCEVKRSSSSRVSDQTVSPKSKRSTPEVALSSRVEAQKQTITQGTDEAEMGAQKAAIEAIEMGDISGSSHRKIKSLESQGAGESGSASHIEMFDGKDTSQGPKALYKREQFDSENERLAADEALVSKIRSISEDRYGIIDQNHWQQSMHAAEGGGTVEEQRGNTASPKNADNEVFEQKSKSGVRPTQPEQEHKDTLAKGESSSVASQPPVKSSDPSCPATQGHKRGDQSDACQQLLSEVRETQRLLRDLYNMFRQSQLSRSVASESVDGRNVPEQSLERPQKSSSALLKNKDGLPCAEEPLNNKQAKLDASSKSGGNHVDGGSPSIVKPEDTVSASIPVSYAVLAYDSSNQQVTVAKNTFLTSPASEQRLTLVEALLRLANPAKFLPHFASLQHAGYEVVAGSRNLLVFKKHHSPKGSTRPAEEDDAEFQGRYSMHTNPIDGTTPQIGNFASPTGFVNYDSVLPMDSAEQAYSEAPKPSDPVRREEPVFSGSSAGWRDTHDESTRERAKFMKRRGRRKLREMFWVGVWVAGGVWAFGVAYETLRGGYSRPRPARPDHDHDR